MSDEPTPTSLEEKQAFARALFGGQPDPEPTEADPDAPPDFDGGVKQPAPSDTDPAVAHNNLIANLLGGKAA
jgi:hypothetical protein